MLEKDAGFRPNGRQADGNMIYQIIDEIKAHARSLDVH